MDAMLIIIAVAMFLLTVVMNVVVMIHFSDEADKNQAWLPKLVVVSSHGVAGLRGAELRRMGSLGELGGRGARWGPRGCGGRAIWQAAPVAWSPPAPQARLRGVAFVCAADPSRR